MTVEEIYDKYYPRGSKARDILERHSRSVAALALEINRTHCLGLAPQDVETAGLLHDIGIFLTDAAGIDCHGNQPYLRHGILGADLLRSEGFPEEICRVAERHTGAGITPEDIDELDLPLPADRVLYPETLLEKLVCYADKFFSKSGTMERKSLDRVRDSMLRHSERTLSRFDDLHSLFA